MHISEITKIISICCIYVAIDRVLNIRMKFSSGITSTESGVEEDGSKIKVRHEEPPVEELVPPDGGWGWLIVLACGIMQVDKVLLILHGQY